MIHIRSRHDLGCQKLHPPYDPIRSHSKPLKNLPNLDDQELKRVEQYTWLNVLLDYKIFFYLLTCFEAAATFSFTCFCSSFNILPLRSASAMPFRNCSRTLFFLSSGCKGDNMNFKLLQSYKKLLAHYVRIVA